MESKLERLLNKGCQLLTRGHDFVEIGGIKWATCNVGAEKPTDAGLYFAWGETQGYASNEICHDFMSAKDGKHNFSITDYKFYIDDGLFKYNEYDGKIVLDTGDDPVHVNWGGRWRLPTAKEYECLEHFSISRFVKNYDGNGTNGLLVMDKTYPSKRIFFPAAGYACEIKGIENVGNYGLYWNSSLGNTMFCGGSIRFNKEQTDWDEAYNRTFGFSVRGILDI